MEVKYILIFYYDLDYVKGIRIVEKIGCDFIIGENNLIGFYVFFEVIEDINWMNFDCFKYYGDVINCIFINEILYVKINNFDIDLINNNLDRNIIFYVIKENEKKVIYVCCNFKLFIYSDMYFDIDVLIISLVFDDGILNDGIKFKDILFKDEIFILDEIVEIKNYYRIKKIIIIYIDEMWGKLYGYYSELEKKFDNIYFVYDGMEIIV